MSTLLREVVTASLRNSLTLMGNPAIAAPTMAIFWKQELHLLKRFQDHTLTMGQLERDAATMEERRRAVAVRIATIREALTEQQHVKGEGEHARRSEELEIEVERERLRERETRLYAIKTNKEYQAAIKEIAESKQRLKDREDQAIGFMEQIEQCETRIAQLSAQLADTETECATQRAALAQEEMALKEAMTRERQARDVVAQQIAGEAMELYRKTQRRFPDALAMVRSGVCSGCHMRLPPQRFVEIRQYVRIYDCPNCHRLLTIEEETSDEA